MKVVVYVEGPSDRDGLKALLKAVTEGKKPEKKRPAGRGASALAMVDEEMLAIRLP